MKIAFITPYLPFAGGVERRLCRVYHSLCKEHTNISCDIIVYGSNATQIELMFNQMDCPIEHLNIIALEKIPCLLYLICTNKYQFVHFWGMGRFLRILRIIYRIKGQKYLYTVCDYPLAYNLILENWKMQVFKKFLTYAACVDLLYPAAEEFVSRYTRGKLYITPGTFTDLDIFQPSKKRK